HTACRCGSPVVGNRNALTRRSDTNMATDLRRLSDPGQFICRFSEEITDRLVRKARGKKYFEFIHAELAQAERIAPVPMALFIVSLQDRNVIAHVEEGERAILPIRWIDVLISGDVIGRPLR